MSEEAVKRNKKNTRKGQRAEQAAKNAIKELGFPACRTTVLSGQFSYLGIPELCGDLKLGAKLHADGQELTAEVKARKGPAGFGSLHGWLRPGVEILWLVRDRHRPLVCMEASTFGALLQHLPQELRLPANTDRLRGLKQAATMNPYAKAALEKITKHTTETEEQQESDALAEMEIEEEELTETEEKPQQEPAPF